MEPLQFLGVPINGTPRLDFLVPAQKTVEDFAPILNAVINDPFFVAFGWTQYTPYNRSSRDLSVFNVQRFWIKTEHDTERTAAQAMDLYTQFVAHIDALVAVNIITHHEWDAMNLDDRAKDAAANAVEGADDIDDADRYALEQFNQHPTLGGVYGWMDEYNGDNPEKWTIARDLQKALYGGRFRDVLLTAFGDHASVVWSRDAGFMIEWYDHG